MEGNNKRAESMKWKADKNQQCQELVLLNSNKTDKPIA